MGLVSQSVLDVSKVTRPRWMSQTWCNLRTSDNHFPNATLSMFRARVSRKVRLSYKTAKIPVHFVTSGVQALVRKHRFDDVESVCLFIGHGRSGHSLVGALLDAHPSMVIAHELDLLRYVRLGFSREQLFHLMVNTSAAFEARGGRWSGYSAKVPGQWQGRWQKLRVIGDKKGFSTCWELRHDPALLDKLRRIAASAVRLIHVIRNPFDNISTMYQKRLVPDEQLESVAKRYFLNCEVVRNTRERVSPEHMLDVWHEDVVADPSSELRRICQFLGVEVTEDYLKACSAIVFDNPHLTRLEVGWSSSAITQVNNKMGEYPHLARYQFET